VLHVVPVHEPLLNSRGVHDKNGQHKTQEYSEVG
jgi:hypothetical protein